MKFKIFDHKKKEFVNDSAYYLGSDGDLYFNNEIGQDLYDFIYAPDNLIPIFSTGQKDIDGTEIYEGDKFTALGFNGDPGGPKEYICKFLEGAYYGFPNFEINSPWEFQLLNDYCDIKIICSFYTNPELMEKG